jgi:hypothetical protein
VSRPADRRRSLPTMMLAPERRRCGLPWWWCAERSVRRLRSAVESSGGGWGRVLSPRVRVDLTRFTARRASLPTTPSTNLSPRLSSHSRGVCRAASCIASQPWRSATEAASCRTQSWRPRGCPSSPSRECQACCVAAARRRQGGHVWRSSSGAVRRGSGAPVLFSAASSDSGLAVASRSCLYASSACSLRTAASGAGNSRRQATPPTRRTAC